MLRRNARCLSPRRGPAGVHAPPLPRPHAPPLARLARAPPTASPPLPSVLSGVFPHFLDAVRMLSTVSLMPPRARTRDSPASTVGARSPPGSWVRGGFAAAMLSRTCGRRWACCRRRRTTRRRAERAGRASPAVAAGVVVVVVARAGRARTGGRVGSGSGVRQTGRRRERARVEKKSQGFQINFVTFFFPSSPRPFSPPPSHTHANLFLSFFLSFFVSSLSSARARLPCQ